MKMKSVMQHNFSQVPTADIPRSNFRRSHGHKTTFDSGYLVPVYVDEALPGDTFNMKATMFARLSTPIVPIMDNIYLDVFFFAVPNRLVWDNWQKFNGEQKNPGDSTDYLTPQIVSPAGGWLAQSLSDYMGLPIQVAGLSVTSLYHRAYNLIYNEWFRDQNLINSAVVDLDDGPDTDTDYVVRRRGKRHDYFTSALPWPQKGVAVSLPLGTSAPVYGNGKSLGLTDNTDTYGLRTDATGNLKAYTTDYNQTLPHVASGGSSAPGASTMGVVKTGESGLVANLASATAATINALREAFQIQKLYERDARGGTRYVEILKAHFGVVSPDQRLQRPEYLGGGSVPVHIQQVPQTAPTSAVSPQGHLAAFGMASMHGVGFTKSFVEHTLIIGIVNVRADLTYQKGIDRKFSRRRRFDYYWPALAHLGEQSILNKEIYATATATDDQVFGYQERWAEYRYAMSKITGKFRSAYATTLDFWHLSQNFTSLPALNQTFIEENPPINRVVAVNTEPQFIFDSYFDLVCARPMPAYSVPGLVDHF